MIRALVEQTFDSTKKYYVLAGLSTDSKPTSGVITGSKFLEVDTGVNYAFDEVNNQWTAFTITEQEIKDEIDNWLDQHPEATTTVEDGTISRAKLDDDLKAKTDEVPDLKSAIGTVPTGKTVEGQIEELQTGKADAVDITLDTPASVMTFEDGADGMPMAVKIGIEPVQAGSGDPSPENIRAISGWTGANIYNKQAKNFFGPNTSPTIGRYYNSNGNVKQSNGWNISNRIEVTGNTQYTLSGISGADAVYHMFLDAEMNEIGLINSYYYTFVTPQNCKYMRICYNANSTNVMLNLGDTALPYEAYVDEQIVQKSITFPESAETVYGGTLTINKDGSGVLAVDRILRRADYYTWTQVDGVFRTNGSYPASINSLDGLCTHYTPASGSLANMPDKSINFRARSWDSNNRIVIKDSSLATGDAFRSYITENNVMVCVRKSTTNYNLTPSQVKTLLGINNLWADTGDILSVEYSADTKLYVDQQIAEKVSASQRLMELIVTANREDTMTATKAYSSGDLLIVNGTLYKASTSIANGATLTEGTNVTATTVAAEIAALA